MSINAITYYFLLFGNWYIISERLKVTFSRLLFSTLINFLKAKHKKHKKSSFGASKVDRAKSNMNKHRNTVIYPQYLKVTRKSN